MIPPLVTHQALYDVNVLHVINPSWRSLASSPGHGTVFICWGRLGTVYNLRLRSSAGALRMMRALPLCDRWRPVRLAGPRAAAAHRQILAASMPE